jgi:hypothetical protein
MLLTKRSPTGSETDTNTIGRVRVSCAGGFCSGRRGRRAATSRVARSAQADGLVLRHPPKLARELQLGDLLLQRRGNVVTGLEVNEPDEARSRDRWRPGAP